MIYKFSFIEKKLINKDIIPHPFSDAGSLPLLGKALCTAVKTKITHQLNTQPKNISAIAKGASVSEKGAELILDCLDALGYVKKSSDAYSFTKRGAKTLDSNSPDNMLYFIEFCDWGYNNAQSLEDTIRNGKPTQINLENFSDYEWEIFSRAMIDIAKSSVKEITSKINLSGKAKSIIDIGGSHGLYSIELCKKYPGLSAIILDLEPVKKYADECIIKNNMLNRVSFKSCNFNSDEIPKDQDGALAFNIIHGFSPEQNTALFKKVFQSLNPGGQLIIFDQIKGANGNSQFSHSITSFMAINLFHQANGNTYSFSEIEKWSRAAGFTNASFKKLNMPGFGMVTCYK